MSREQQPEDLENPSEIRDHNSINNNENESEHNSMLVPSTNHLRRRDHEIICEQLQHRQNLEDQRQTWRSCCLSMDRRAVAYFCQFFFCVAVTAFCISQLAIYTDSKYAEMCQKYVVLLGLFVGFQLGVTSAAYFVVKQ